MTITNLKMLEVIASIREFHQQLEPMPVKLSYTVSKHEKSLQQHAQEYDAARIKLCELLSDKEDDGVTPLMTSQSAEDAAAGKSFAPEYVLSNENRKRFGEELVKLQAEEIIVPEYTCKSDVLDGVNIAPAYFPSLSVFLDYFVSE